MKIGRPKELRQRCYVTVENAMSGKRVSFTVYGTTPRKLIAAMKSAGDACQGNQGDESQRKAS